MRADTTDEKPIAMIVDTQLGTGRNAFLDYTARLSSQRRFYEIDRDILLRDADGVLQNLILHQDLTNPKEVERVVTELMNAGYTVGVRALATSYLDSKMSQIETQDFGHSVTSANFYMVPFTLNYLEENGKCDFIEIFKRGTAKRDYVPELVYAKFNAATKAQTLAALADCENVSHRDHPLGFASAQAALDKTRRLETIRCAPTIPTRIRAVEPNALTNPVLHAHLYELKSHLDAYQQSCKLTKCTVHAMATAKRLDDNSRTI